MESLVFVTLAPIATILMLVVALVAWRRRGEPGAWALVAFSVAEAGWLACDALGVLAKSPEATIRLGQAAVGMSALIGVAWLAFVLSYMGRYSRRAHAGVMALLAWCLGYGAMALTNGAHRLVWSSWETVPDGSFLLLRTTLGPLGWVQTAFMWAAMLLSLGAIFWAYAGANTRTRQLSRWILTGATVPLLVNASYMLSIGPLAKDFTPIAMAVSSAAFALGLARYQFLDLRPVARAALVENLQEGVLVLDTEDRVADANPALLRILGRTEPCLGLALDDLDPALAVAIASGADAPIRKENGRDVRYYDLRVSPLSDFAGRSTGRLVLLHDVTKRRAEKGALRRANADLYNANAELGARNEELDAFAHTVAHDLKNPIQGVLGFAEILRDDADELSAEESRGMVEEVIRSAQKMESIVDELLLLAGVRQTSFEPRPLDSDAILDEALARLSRQPGASGVDVFRRSEWPVALGHAPWVEEIWVNYLSNAAKYGGPTIVLGADITDHGHARFWVHDDGPGIPREAQSKLFVPFSRLHRTEVEGHGLGLSIVRRITERLGGTCGVESQPGLGTRFWFALPLAPEADGHTPEPARTPDALLPEEPAPEAAPLTEAFGEAQAVAVAEAERGVEQSVRMPSLSWPL